MSDIVLGEELAKHSGSIGAYAGLGIMFGPFLGAKMMAWTSIVLGAADQLRHRVAFALSQVLVHVKFSAIVFKRALVILPRTIALSYLTRLYPVPVYDSIVRMWAHV